MLAGDVHGSLAQMGYLFQEAMEFEVDRIFCLGDFGFWEHTAAGKRFLDRAEEVAALAGIPVYWLDGNHENHTMLRRRYRSFKDEEGFWKIRPHILYSPRGHRFEWEGCKFVTLGGAYSIDKYHRSEGFSWWPEEQIEQHEVDACGTEKVDIMLSHDLPHGIPMQEIMKFRGFNYTVIPESEENRIMIREAVDNTHPDLLFHGHYHLYYKRTLELGDGHRVTVQGLGCDGYGRESYTIIEFGEGEYESALG